MIRGSVPVVKYGNWAGWNEWSLLPLLVYVLLPYGWISTPIQELGNKDRAIESLMNGPGRALPSYDLQRSSIRHAAVRLSYCMLIRSTASGSELMTKTLQSWLITYTYIFRSIYIYICVCVYIYINTRAHTRARAHPCRAFLFGKVLWEKLGLNVLLMATREKFFIRLTVGTLQDGWINSQANAA